jgi:hypothetical protein
LFKRFLSLPFETHLNEYAQSQADRDGIDQRDVAPDDTATF